MRILILFLSALFALPVLAADQYLCTAEKASGFSFNARTMKWEHTKFDTNQKFIIRRIRLGDREQKDPYSVDYLLINEDDDWLWTGFKGTFFSGCREHDGPVLPIKMIICERHNFILNMDNLEFARSTTGALTLDIDKLTADTPPEAFVEFGSCSPF